MLNKKQLPSNRKLGLFFSLIFAFFGIFFYKNSKLLALYFLGISVFFITIAIIYPKILGPLNKGWMKLGYFMGRMINPLVLGVIFYLFITPVAIVTRLFGRDELRLKRSNKDSYWVDRIPAGPEGNSFNNQF